MAGDRIPGVTDLRARPGYRPDVTNLACARVAAAREQAGLSLAAFAATLEPLLGWAPAPDLVAAWESTVAPPGQVVIACEVLASRTSGADPGKGADEVASAAGEAEAEQSWLLAQPGPQSVDSLWEGSLEIARAANRSAAEMFGASHRIRREALELAAQTHRPGTLSDLYVIAGQATALMASTAFDLGRWDESATLARSAVSYATLVGNSSLQAWTLGLAALLANWRNEPDTALRHFKHGLQVAPPGTPRVRLRYIALRSYALLGDSYSAGQVADQARCDQDDAPLHKDLLSEETGGEFAFGPARAEACAAAAWLDLRDGQKAGDAARRALSDLAALPASRQPVSQITGARIDLATACLMQGERGEAEEALSHVFAVPGPLRNVSLSGRLARTRKNLASRSWARDPVAQQLNDALGEWFANQPQPGSS
jgi:hypothetical protein